MKNLKTIKFNNGEVKKSIVLILESPYLNEFNGKIAIGPACGPTGNNISNYLLSNILKYRLMTDEKSKGCYVKTNNEISEGLYALVLINSIPFQCLYECNDDKSKKKELVEKCIVEDKFKNYLVNEIYLAKPSIIINCITTGESKEIVNKLLLKEFSNKLLLQGLHPSSGYFTIGFDKII